MVIWQVIRASFPRWVIKKLTENRRAESQIHATGKNINQNPPSLFLQNPIRKTEKQLFHRRGRQWLLAKTTCLMTRGQ